LPEGQGVIGVVDVGFPCCFCGKAIDEKKPDPCHLTIKANGGSNNLYSCHAECFKHALTKAPDLKGLFDPSDF